MCLTGLVFAEPTTQPAYKDYGEPMKLAESDTIEVTTLLKDPAAYDQKTVRVSGKVTDVCKASGCWIAMKPDGAPVRLLIQFTCGKDEGKRIMPLDVVGKTAIVEGVAELEEVSEKDARHYAEDAGASKEEIEKIKGPQKQVVILSPAARVIQ